MCGLTVCLDKFLDLPYAQRCGGFTSLLKGNGGGRDVGVPERSNVFRNGGTAIGTELSKDVTTFGVDLVDDPLPGGDLLGAPETGCVSDDRNGASSVHRRIKI